MATSVITVASGGLPVTDVTATAPIRGMPVTEAIAIGTVKYGIPVTKVANGLPVTFVVDGGGGGTSAEASAFLARTTGLDATHTSAYTALIDGLVADGIWAKLDVLYIYATQDSTTAALNLVSSTYNGTVNGSPTFTADRGFTGAAGSTKYINTGFNASTASLPKFTQNSGHLSVWNVTNTWAAGPGIGTYTAGSGAGNYATPRDSGSGYGYLRVNGPGLIDQITVSDASGHFLANRSGANNREGYRNSTNIQTMASNASIVPQNLTIYALGCNFDGVANGAAQQHAMASIGSSLSSGDATAFYNRLRTYMTTIGVP